MIYLLFLNFLFLASTNDLRSLALPTKGIAYGAYGISEMLLNDSILGFSGKLRKLQRQCK